MYRQRVRAALAEVRMAEAQLHASRQSVYAAQLEFQAQGLLVKLAAIEEERSGLLHTARVLEQKEAQINQKIVALQSQQQNLKGKKAEIDQKTAEIKKNIGALRFEILQEKVRLAARGVAVLRNELKLLKDILITPTPLEPGKADSPRKPGLLGVLAYRISQHVKKRIEQLREEIKKKKKQLRELKEMAFFRALFRFLGAIVGGLLGGPAGMKLGAMAGGMIGGVLAAIKQGKPFSAIFGAALKDGADIAMNTNWSSFSSQSASMGMNADSGGDLSQTVLQRTPRMIDADIVKDGLQNTFMRRVQQKSGDTALKMDWKAFGSELAPYAKDLDTQSEPYKEKLYQAALSFLNKLKGEKPALVDQMAGKNSDGEMLDPREQVKRLARQISNEALLEISYRSQHRRDQLVGKLILALLKFRDAKKAVDQAAINAVMQELKIEQALRSTFQQWLAHFKGHTLSHWVNIVPPLQGLVRSLFPHWPEHEATMIEQFRYYLDPESMQALTQRYLAVWHKAVEEKMGALEKQLQTMPPANVQDDQEKLLEWQIQNLESVAKGFEGFLEWLQKPDTTERNEVSLKLSKKLSELQNAETKLKITKTRREIGQLQGMSLEQQLKKAGINIEIAKLGLEIVKREEKSAALLFQRKQLDVKRSKLLQQQNRLQTERRKLREKALQAVLRKAQYNEIKDRAALTAAWERAKAARNQAGVYQKFERWYWGSRQNGVSRELKQLLRLRREYRAVFSRVSRLGREMLRYLRGLGKDASAIPANPQISRAFWLAQALRELDSRYIGTTPQTHWKVLTLRPKQIPPLFRKRGFCLDIEMDRTGKVRREDFPSLLRFRINYKNNPRIFSITIAAWKKKHSRKKTHHDPVDFNQWESKRLWHSSVSPVLVEIAPERYISKNIVTRQHGYLKGRDSNPSKHPSWRTLVHWWGGTRLPENVHEESYIGSQAVKIMLQQLQVGDRTGTHVTDYRKLQGMPLTGRTCLWLHISGEGKGESKAPATLPNRVDIIIHYVTH